MSINGHSFPHLNLNRVPIAPEPERNPEPRRWPYIVAILAVLVAIGVLG